VIMWRKGKNQMKKGKATLGQQKGKREENRRGSSHKRNARDYEITRWQSMKKKQKSDFSQTTRQEKDRGLPSMPAANARKREMREESRVTIRCVNISLIFQIIKEKKKGGARNLPHRQGKNEEGKKDNEGAVFPCRKDRKKGKPIASHSPNVRNPKPKEPSANTAESKQKQKKKDRKKDTPFPRDGKKKRKSSFDGTVERKDTRK